MNIASLFQQGGPVMVVLLVLSILAVAIILAKLFQFFRSGLRRSEFIEPVISALNDRQNNKALELLQQQRSPVARVMESAVRCGVDPGMSAQDTEAEVSRVGSARIRDLESWLRGLSAIAHLSPLLGLLGTVTGMITAFMRLEEAGNRVDPSILSGGIWEALLTTAFGLTVAIPAMGGLLLSGRRSGSRARRDERLQRESAALFSVKARSVSRPVMMIESRMKGMEFEGRARIHSHLDMAPLMDMVFLLLGFFHAHQHLPGCRTPSSWNSRNQAAPAERRRRPSRYYWIKPVSLRSMVNISN
uniref:MotA/TolQ/ExbB proton channel n=1 Tax=uncultured organism TaxID=155900 RepID=E3T341_9ZZZZ|nr:MotA/TolQ/ExbB proton channel [uncultured organism]